MTSCYAEKAFSVPLVIFENLDKKGTTGFCAANSNLKNRVFCVLSTCIFVI